MKIFFRISILIVLLPLTFSKENNAQLAVANLMSVPPSKEAIIEDSPVGPTVFHQASKAYNIEGSPNVSIDKLVRLTDFGSFRPGLTIDEASRRFGRPVRVENTDFATTAVFDLPTARIEVEEADSSSGCTTAHRRTVYAYPKPSVYECLKLEQLVDPSLSNFEMSGVIEVAVSKAAYDERVWILLKDGCVLAMNWWKMPDP
jgi:hypothetical protein